MKFENEDEDEQEEDSDRNRFSPRNPMIEHQPEQMADENLRSSPMFNHGFNAAANVHFLTNVFYVSLNGFPAND